MAVEFRKSMAVGHGIAAVLLIARSICCKTQQTISQAVIQCICSAAEKNTGLKNQLQFSNWYNSLQL
eukprot:SAG11_NODE_2771_length_2990_cov_2.518506_1_plen_67_part_00